MISQAAHALAVYIVHAYSIYNSIFNTIENNVIKCMVLNKNYFSNSQFVFCLPTSHLLLTGAANRHNIEIEIHR